VFRDGFGCSAGGKWLDENAWTFGFVVSYPIDPDDRRDGSRCLARVDRAVPIDPKTGYKSEPWHVRFIGVEDAARFHDAWLASGPGTPGEITLEQWLRALRGLKGDTELPVCDGCQCGACSTLADDDSAGLCKGESLRLDESGSVKAADEEPRILDAHAIATPDGATLVDVSIHAAAHTPTQTPATTQDGPTYVGGATFEALVPYPDAKPHRYVDLPGAWRIGVEPVPAGAASWPWRTSLARPALAATWNRANIVLPAKAGDSHVQLRVVLPTGASGLRVTLLRDGVEHGARDVTRD
jgi:D-alanyl-D-alanine carboxypeptidase